MKVKKDDLPSIYDEKKFKKAKLRVNKLYLFGTAAILLVIFRFLNLFTWWHIDKLELTANPANKQVNYTFLGFSSFNKAMEKSTELTRKYPVNTTVVSYFNLFHPGIFLVRNNANLSLVDLGKVVVTADTGLSTFTVFLSDTMEKNDLSSTRFDNSLLSKVLSQNEQPGNKKVSFLLKSPEKSTYLKIPYLFYFYFPLLMIFILSRFYSSAVLTSFFYYPVLFFLFDFRNLFFRVPFQWLNIKVSEPLENAAAVIVVLLLTLLGVLGLMNWKKRSDIFKERLIVLFFLLLPLFLRY